MIRRLCPLLLSVLLLCAPAATWSTSPDTRPASVPALAQALEPARQAEAKVWANTDSGVYHRPSCRWYGNTKKGAYMTEKQAKAKGYRACMKC